MKRLRKTGGHGQYCHHQPSGPCRHNVKSVFILITGFVLLTSLGLVFFSMLSSGSISDHTSSLDDNINNKGYSIISIDQAQTALSYILHKDNFSSSPKSLAASEEDPLSSLPTLIARILKYSISFVQEARPVAYSDFKELGRRFQSYTLLSTLLDFKPHLLEEPLLLWKNTTLHKFNNLEQVESLRTDMERLLLPWYNRTVMQASGSGRGIVTLIGNKQFEFGYNAIRSCRKVVGSTLPIIVYYGGRADLDEDKAAILEKFSNTLVVDLFSILPSLDNTGITGWAMKPFVMASSPFEEVLFMDADVGFFQDPAVMFDMEGYKRAGSVFFHDRLINEGKRKIHGWLETFLLEKSPDASQVQMLNHYMTNHEQESGIVVINKQSTAFYGLLLASAMLTPPYQATVYSYSLGDKETFWISAELLKIPYYFVSGYGGAVGYLNPDLENSVCGNLYHPDEDWQPLWWNGGVHINRHRTWWPPFNFFHELIHFIMMRPTKTFYDEMTHWVTNKLGEEGYWTYEIPNQPYCFSPRNFKANSGLLTPREQRLVKETIQGAKHVHSAQDDLKKLKPV